MEDPYADDELRLALRCPSPSFERRTVTVAPGSTRPYRESEWVDALVVVERGAVELECVRGGRRAFAAGAVLWLSGLPLRAVHNAGDEPARLVAVSRRRGRAAAS